MERPWLAPIPGGIPAEIDLDRYASLNDMLATSCARFADLPAFNSMGTVLTFRQLDEGSRAFAPGCRSAPGCVAAIALH